VNLGQSAIICRSTGKVIRVDGSGSKIMDMMWFNSSVIGRIDFKKERSFRYAEYVESSEQARFHGFRPHVRLTRMTPKDQTSFGAEA
jgi:hypothetical protein